MRSLELRVIDRLVGDEEYVDQILLAVKARAQGVEIDLNKVVDNLHDSATLKESRSFSKEDQDTDAAYAMYGQDWESA